MKINANQTVYKMSPNNEPTASCSPGEVVTFITKDCFSNQMTSEDTLIEDVDVDAINPATGPLAVKGAKPNDVLKVTIKQIEVGCQGVMTVWSEEVWQGIVNTPETKIIPIEEGYAVFNDKIKLPIEPMIGVIGTAPAVEEVPCEKPGSHGSNMDNSVITEGAVVYLPVWVEGALLALGDLHAIMGDGELGICGLEVPGEITVKIELISEQSLSNPVVETAHAWYTVASAVELETASQQAKDDMFDFLHTRLSLSVNEVVMLMSLACDLQVCQIINSRKTVRVKLNKKALKNYDLKF